MNKEEFEQRVSEYNKVFDEAETNYNEFDNGLKCLSGHDVVEFMDLIGFLADDCEEVCAKALHFATHDEERIYKTPWNYCYFITIGSCSTGDYLSKIFKTETEEVMATKYTVVGTKIALIG